MFRSRNEWFARELQSHRREWGCPSCLETFTDKTKFSVHLLNVHPSVVAGSQIDAIILQSEEPVDKIPASDCLLCDEWESNLLDPKQDSKRLFLNKGETVEPCGTLGQFRRHLGRHSMHKTPYCLVISRHELMRRFLVEQLALFALPMAEDQDMEDDSLAASDSENDGQVNPDVIQKSGRVLEESTHTFCYCKCRFEFGMVQCSGIFCCTKWVHIKCLRGRAYYGEFEAMGMLILDSFVQIYVH